MVKQVVRQVVRQVMRQWLDRWSDRFIFMSDFHDTRFILSGSYLQYT